MNTSKLLPSIINIAVLACLLGSALQSRHKVYNIISTF